jgi:hypothetical protein
MKELFEAVFSIWSAQKAYKGIMERTDGESQHQFNRIQSRESVENSTVEAGGR